MRRKKLLAFLVSLCLLAGSIPVSGQPEFVGEAEEIAGEVPKEEEAWAEEEVPGVKEMPEEGGAPGVKKVPEAEEAPGVVDVSEAEELTGVKDAPGKEGPGVDAVIQEADMPNTLREKENEDPGTEGAVYTEGRALVLMREADSGSLRGASGDVSMEKIYTLEGTEISGELLGAGVEDQASAVYLVQSDSLSTEELLERLKENPQVETAEPDYYLERTSLSNDPFIDSQWYLQQESQVPGGIQAGSAWAYKTGDPEYVVGVVDSGVDYTHPDLVDNLWVSPEGTYGFNNADANGDVMDEDEGGHGTHVAGIIGACGNNGTGVSGVSQQVKIMSLINEDPGHIMSVYATIKCYDYAKEQCLRGTRMAAMNNSWGFTKESYSTLMMQVVDSFYEETGVVSVFSSGNDGWDMDGQAGVIFGGKKSVICVNNSNNHGELNSGSNRGKKTTDIAAPGKGILSCVPQRLSQAYTGREADPQTILFREDFEDGSDVFQCTPDAGDGTACITEDPVEINGRCLEWAVEIENGRDPWLISSPMDMSAYEGTKYFALQCMSEDISLNRANQKWIYVAIGNKDGSLQSGVMDAAYPGQWTAISVKIEEPEKVDWEHFTFFVAFLKEAGDDSEEPTKVYLDNIGFTNFTQPYAVYTGTSMAAPVVSGSLALLKSIFPDESMDKIRARVLGGVTRTAELEQSCISGGYLNLEKATQNPYPVLDTLSQEGDVGTIEGYFFGSSTGSLTLEGQQLEIQDWQEEKITFRLPETIREGEWEFRVTRRENAEEYGSHFFEVEAAENLFEKLSAPDLYAVENSIALDGEEGYSLASWQNKIYAYVTEIGWKNENNEAMAILWCYDIVTGKWEAIKTEIPLQSVYWRIAAEEGKVYFINSVQKEIYSYTIATGVTKNLSIKGMDSKEIVIFPAIVLDGESFWLIGGSTQGEGGPESAAVWKINKNTGEAKRMPDLKYPRSKCTAVCSQGKITVVGGLDASGKFEPHTEVWENGQWVTKASYPDVHHTQGGFVAAGAVENGILTVGPPQAQGGRNQTVLYHADTDVWEPLDLVPANSAIQMPQGVAYKGYLYVLARKAWGTGDLIFLRTPADTVEPEKPSIPLSVKAAPGDGCVKLSWGQVQGATGYVVYGYTKGDKAFDTRKIVRGSSSASWTEKGLAPGTQRRYLVRAYKDIDGINYYSGCSDTAVTAVKPKAAVIKTAVPGKGTARITLMSRPSGAEGYAYCTSTDNKTFRIVAKGPKMPYTMKGLVKGTNYIKVRSYVKDCKGKTVYGTWSKVWKVKVK